MKEQNDLMEIPGLQVHQGKLDRAEELRILEYYRADKRRVLQERHEVCMAATATTNTALMALISSMITEHGQGP